MSPADALTGAVALEKGFIDFDQFRAALEACEAGAAPSMREALAASAALDVAKLDAVDDALRAVLLSAEGDPTRALEATLTDITQDLTSVAELIPAAIRPRSDVRCPPRRYELGRVLGTGGFGEVYEAVDVELGRPVAVKVLRPDRATPDARSRFHNEARIGAILEHPNIVPVYHAGPDDSGDLFIALKYVRGRSLAEIIDALAAEDTQTQLAFSVASRVEIMIQVAQGVAFAHSRGVIHRDLKPANIMVGAHGEVFVMDWGLAKLEAPPAANGAARSWEPPQDLELGMTREGHVVGSPAYMGPEQALAQHEAVDTRSDVYALGATLYELLTLSQPFPDAGSMQQLIDQIVSEAPLPPRAREPSVPFDLEAICLRCLEKDPDDRYPSAAELLDDLRALRDGQVVSAAGAGPLARARAWARRNRTTATIGVCALAMASLTGISAAFWVIRERALSAEREFSAHEEAIRETALAAREDADEAWLLLKTAPDADTSKRTGLGLAALQAAQRWQALAPDDPDSKLAVYRAALQLGEVASASEQWDLASQALASALGLGVDDDHARRLLAEIEEESQAEAIRRRAEIEEILGQAAAGELSREPDGVEDAVFTIVRYPESQTVQLLTDTLDRISTELLAVEREVLSTAQAPDETEARAGYRRLDGLPEALEQRGRTRPGDDLPQAAWNDLRLAARRLQLRELRDRGTLPDSGQVLDPLALVGRRQRDRLGSGRLDVARVCCDALGRLDIREGAVESLGRYLRAEDAQERAIPAALALCRLGGERALTLAHWARRRHGVDGNLARQVSGLLIALRLEQRVPLEAGTAVDYLRRGESRQAQGDHTGAIADLSRAIELDPTSVEAWNFRGSSRRLSGDYEGALEDFSTALRLEPDFTPAWSNRGNARRRLGDTSGAIKDLTRAIEIAPQFATAYSNRAAALEDSGDHAGAVADCTKAIELQPSLGAARVIRGKARISLQDYAGAIEDLTRALEIDPRDGAALVGRGRAFAKQRKLAEAARDFTRALELDPEAVAPWVNRGTVRRDQGDLAGACADFSRAIELEPNLAAAWNNRGAARQSRGDLDGAISDAERAVQLDPKMAIAWGQLATSLCKKGEFTQAIPSLERFLELAPNHPKAEDVRGLLKYARSRLPKDQR